MPSRESDNEDDYNDANDDDDTYGYYDEDEAKDDDDNSLDPYDECSFRRTARRTDGSFSASSARSFADARFQRTVDVARAYHQAPVTPPSPATYHRNDPRVRSQGAEEAYNSRNPSPPPGLLVVPDGDPTEVLDSESDGTYTPPGGISPSASRPTTPLGPRPQHEYDYLLSRHNEPSHDQADATTPLCGVSYPAPSTPLHGDHFSPASYHGVYAPAHPSYTTSQDDPPSTYDDQYCERLDGPEELHIHNYVDLEALRDPEDDEDEPFPPDLPPELLAAFAEGAAAANAEDEFIGEHVYQTARLSTYEQYDREAYPFGYTEVDYDFDPESNHLLGRGVLSEIEHGFGLRLGPRRIIGPMGAQLVASDDGSPASNDDPYGRHLVRGVHRPAPTPPVRARGRRQPRPGLALEPDRPGPRGRF